VKILITLSFCAVFLVGGASVAQAQDFEPGFTDVPNAVRTADDHGPQFIPGYTDVPNASRLGREAEAPVVGRGDVSAPADSVTAVSAAPGFDWRDAAIGAGTATASLLLAGALALAVRRRARLVTSP
jgi:hypothetical protein